MLRRLLQSVVVSKGYSKCDANLAAERLAFHWLPCNNLFVLHLYLLFSFDNNFNLQLELQRNENTNRAKTAAKSIRRIVKSTAKNYEC